MVMTVSLTSIDAQDSEAQTFTTGEFSGQYAEIDLGISGMEPLRYATIYSYIGNDTEVTIPNTITIGEKTFQVNSVKDDVFLNLNSAHVRN